MKKWASSYEYKEQYVKSTTSPQSSLFISEENAVGTDSNFIVRNVEYTTKKASFLHCCKCTSDLRHEWKWRTSIINYLCIAWGRIEFSNQKLFHTKLFHHHVSFMSLKAYTFPPFLHSYDHTALHSQMENFPHTTFFMPHVKQL